MLQTQIRVSRNRGPSAHPERGLVPITLAQQLCGQRARHARHRPPAHMTMHHCHLGMRHRAV